MDNWAHPPLRRGIGGVFDRLAGPGATTAEYALQMCLPALAAVSAYLYIQWDTPFWPWWKTALLCVFAFDMVGGIVTNSTSSAKRWFHREGQTTRNHMAFVSLHVAHITLVAIVFRDFDGFYAVALSGYLLVAAYLILSLPLYLQRSAALSLCALGMLLELYGWGPSTEIAWFTPFLLLKLLVAHLLYEEPYRP